MATRVLLVEDNPDVRAALGELLEAQGLDVTLAENGRDALDRMSDGPAPAWIVLDLLMPVMGGREFLQVLDAAGPHPPVTVLTALSYDAETIGLEERFACRVLSKSTDIGTLLDVAKSFAGTTH